MTLTREKQLFLWCVLAPLLALLTISILLVRPGPLNPYVALTMVLGIPACWYLKKWGFVIGFLAVSVLLFTFSSSWAQEKIWYSVVMASTLLTLGIAYFSLEEAENLVQENLLQGSAEDVEKKEKEDLRIIQTQHQSEISHFQTKIDALSKELESYRTQCSDLKSLLDKTKSQEVDAQQEIAHLSQQIESFRLDLETKNLRDEHLLEELLEKRKEVLELRDQIHEKDVDLETLNREIVVLKNELYEIQAELDSKATKDERIFEELLENRKEVLHLRDLLDEANEELKNRPVEIRNSVDESALEDLKKLHETNLDVYRKNIETLEEQLKSSQDEALELSKLKQEINQLEEAYKQRPTEIKYVQDETALASLREEYQERILAYEDNIETLSHELKASKEKSQHLEAAMEAARAEIHVFRHEIKRYQQDYDLLKNEKTLQSQQLEHALNQLSDENLRKQQMQQELQAQVQALSKNMSEKELELQGLQVLMSKKEQDLFNLQFRLDSAHEDIQKLQVQIADHENKQMHDQHVKNEWIEKIDLLINEKEKLELRLHQLSLEVERLPVMNEEKNKAEKAFQEISAELQQTQQILNQVLEDQQKTKALSSSEESSLRRRAEGMYLQLREQFNEKSAVLDETRRQLFHTQEALLQLQNTLREQEQFSTHPAVHELIQHILKMQKSYSLLKKQYESEIGDLHEIVSLLSQS
ncbi:MAG: hypothetical protein BGO14_04145 [Chlamydiales bacterium 38-26]|nr:hypothetical protein [Chlamydiales bacterium]OJV07688.1 MAG: hypothetical protein BGO14_04145 [Chlamydiales bacterium 38-26]